MSNDSLGDRMKEYENVTRIYLPRRFPVIIRLDMRAGHTYTKNFNRPFDFTFHKAMVETAKVLCHEIGGCKLGYTQSDEISLLLTNNDTITTELWFNNNLQKIVSLSAASASINFQRIMRENAERWSCGNQEKYLNNIDGVMFDSRAFILPEDEVVNYFIWRQQDATRNSIQMSARAYYSHKECQNKNCNELQEMLFQKGINWNNYESWKKRGSLILKRYCEEMVHYKDKYGVECNENVARPRWLEEPETPFFLNIKDHIDKLIMPQED